MVKTLAAFVILLLCTFGAAQAALISTCPDLVYDSVQNITWYDPAPTQMSWTYATTVWDPKSDSWLYRGRAAGASPQRPAQRLRTRVRDRWGISTILSWAILPADLLPIRVLLLTCCPTATGRVRSMRRIRTSRGTSTSTTASRTPSTSSSTITR